jgi:hypothetical protein
VAGAVVERKTVSKRGGWVGGSCSGLADMLCGMVEMAVGLGMADSSALCPTALPEATVEGALHHRCRQQHRNV